MTGTAVLPMADQEDSLCLPGGGHTGGLVEAEHTHRWPPRPRAEAGGGRPRGRGLTALHPLGACEPSSTPPRDLAPCPYRLGGHSPSFGLGSSVSQWTWVVSVESPPTALAGRQSPPLTLMPSNRDRARRGRSARNVRSDLMGPISAKPRVLATRLIRETCGR